ncbi:unnamed protein product [Symbiodinium natans]|uniref:Uncharacterized protein n=1 Tax=Symbiodinium natans TaxID=878477 RepID=A0A812I5J8_9DINO|nr:unnamed protein product [Symbiodinium natans]
MARQAVLQGNSAKKEHHGNSDKKEHQRASSSTTPVLQQPLQVHSHQDTPRAAQQGQSQFRGVSSLRTSEIVAKKTDCPPSCVGEASRFARQQRQRFSESSSARAKSVPRCLCTLL